MCMKTRKTIINERSSLINGAAATAAPSELNSKCHVPCCSDNNALITATAAATVSCEFFGYKFECSFFASAISKFQFGFFWLLIVVFSF